LDDGRVAHVQVVDIVASDVFFVTHGCFCALREFGVTDFLHKNKYYIEDISLKICRIFYFFSVYYVHDLILQVFVVQIARDLARLFSCADLLFILGAHGIGKGGGGVKYLKILILHCVSEGLDEAVVEMVLVFDEHANRFALLAAFNYVDQRLEVGFVLVRLKIWQLII
jgi:hypothetical protein